ncbi:MAG: ABC transporter ATP-binding protein [Acidimicrobiia bacterium]|nr:ABC transporter ATP-binding protein [Acidimicrobiia bacterium]MBT8249856.1 ABC transporter ATP-binding protein [Acidimicrobiia bacterium]NND13896.1 ABC transporter ATP-binding protein [Acidimicrobiia bacterium]NNL28025.1 ABC transporter ATP-binding protein [Acidimicrobiia bacterium]NNL47458.1 ABC transporter ATP-binding protein [Acidimicrobiia bacterium]
MTSPALVPNAIIEVNDVSKWFGDKVANSKLTCSFGPGVTGLLGPNGAGKTTLLRMLAGLTQPSTGSISVDGLDPRGHPKLFERVGLVPEEDAVYEFLTARQYVTYAAQLTGLADPSQAAADALATVQLTESADRKLGEFSKGMKQRTRVAAAIAHRPDILILDEPLNGTDPVQRARLIALIRSLAANGATVIVSSHVLAEVERIADRVLAMTNGRLAAAGNVEAIRAAMIDIPYKVRIDADDLRGLGALLIGHPLITSVAIGNSEMVIETNDLGALGRDLPGLAIDSGVRITRFQPEDMSLEAVFGYLDKRR